MLVAKKELLEWVSGYDPLLGTFLLAMLPIAELRLALPYAMLHGIPFWKAYLVSVCGNMVPIVPLLLFYGRLHDWLAERPPFDRIFERMRSKVEAHRSAYEKWGAAALVTFVAVPLPVTGAWTGAFAAFLFGIRFLPAFLMLTAGVCCAGLIVGAAVKLGVLSLSLL